MLLASRSLPANAPALFRAAFASTPRALLPPPPPHRAQPWSLFSSAIFSMAATEVQDVTALPARAHAVLDFWLGQGWEAVPPGDVRKEHSKKWFMGSPEVDAQIVSQFGDDCAALRRGEYDSWQAKPLSALAGVLIGDQFTRNAFRGTADMYSLDGKILDWVKGLVASGSDRELKPIQRVWIYMPFMHSEALADQQECVRLFEGLAEEAKAGGHEELASMLGMNVKYAMAHVQVVEKWGRFPHRNGILGRESTPEELAGIADGTIAKF